MAATDIQQRVQTAAMASSDTATTDVTPEEMCEEKMASLPPELLNKHRLQNSWTLWFFKDDNKIKWELRQVEVITFDTVEDFWAGFNYLEPASQLRPGTDYSLFKTGIKPMWEDERNTPGGRWLFNLENSRGQRQEFLDIYWLDVMLLLIGEGFGEHGETVNGAVVNVRLKSDKIAVWTSEASNKTAVMGIGKKLKEQLNIPAKTSIGFQTHSESQSRNSSALKFSYTV